MLLPAPSAIAEVAAQRLPTLGADFVQTFVRAVIPGESETTLQLAQKVAAGDELIDAARRLGFEVELS